MTGIILLSFLFIVFVVYCLLIYLPIRWAKRHGITGRKRFYIGIASFIVVSVLFFGKNVVSYGAFRYYCANEAGLTIYKTLAQWQAENPGVWETLEPTKGFSPYENREKYPDVPLKREFNRDVYSTASSGNQRIILYRRTEYPFWGAVTENSYIVWDNETQEILAKYQYVRWENTWDSVPNRNGWRDSYVGHPILGKAICDPKNDEFYNYIDSLSNFNLTQEEQ